MTYEKTNIDRDFLEIERHNFGYAASLEELTSDVIDSKSADILTFEETEDGLIITATKQGLKILQENALSGLENLDCLQEVFTQKKAAPWMLINAENLIGCHGSSHIFVNMKSTQITETDEYGRISLGSGDIFYHYDNDACFADQLADETPQFFQRA